MGNLQRKLPNIHLGGRLHRRLLSGVGMGSVLLNKGGAGGGSSYESVQDYSTTTGNRPAGSGLGEKLGKLMVKPLTKKRHNIRFDM
jgi:hypothetical protein